eukprot:5717233-Amphidinium_carterae.3
MTLKQQQENGGELSEVGSRISSAMARAGPCAGWEELQVLKKYSSFGEKLRHATSKDAIEKCFEDAKPLKTVLAALMASCKACVADLRSARTAKRKLEEKREKEDVKKLKKEGQKDVADKMLRKCILKTTHGSTMSIVRDFCAIECLVEPAIVSGQEWILDLARNELVKSEVQDFCSMYLSCSRRLTSGRGQRPILNEDVEKDVLSALQTKLPSSMVPFGKEQLQSAKDVLKKSAGMALFAMTAGSEASPALEKKALPTLRLTLRGCRSVAVVRSWELAAFVGNEKTKSSCQEWLDTCTAAQLESYVAAGGKIYRGTLSAGDTLFTPPAHLVGQTVTSGEDHVGFRVCVQLPVNAVEPVMKFSQTLEEVEKDGLNELLELARERGDLKESCMKTFLNN